ncbi:MAG: FixH family protein [Bacteriovorax sp.]|nr:FixH family protein [Bacteriovorax sp.]
MPKKIAVLFLFALIATGLYFIKKELKTSSSSSQFVILNWHHHPEKIILGDDVEFTFRLKDKKNRPIENAKMQVEATMNHAGMIPITTEATPLPNGVYKFKIKLSMAGDWILFLTIKKADGNIIKKEVFFKTDSE